MSDEAIAVQQISLSLVILGTDALSAALPSTPTQLANACLAGGFDDVFPATWGDELIAAGCLEQLAGHTGPAIFCACPRVFEQLRGEAKLGPLVLPFISPPVALARYLRALHSDKALTITYVGDCPGADDKAIDSRVSPHELLTALSQRGIDLAMQSRNAGTQLGHERHRYYSLPGGVPSPQWLGAQQPMRTLVDVHACDAIAELLGQAQSRKDILIDLAPHLGCECAGAIGGSEASAARETVIALEPPRSHTPILDASARIELSLAPTEHHDADVAWGEFLAALPATLAMHPESGHGSASTSRISRTAPRRAKQKKTSLPRAYMATRARARRERGAQPREKHASPIVAAQGSATPIAAPRHEAAIHHAGLTTADRWLLAALMLSSSVLIAVLTSALTVRGMQRTDAPVIAASAQPIVSVRPAPSMAVRDTTVVGSPQNEESALVPVDAHADSTPARAEPSVGASPSQTAPLLPRHVQATHTPKRSAPRAERRSVTIAEQMRTPPSILPPSASASSAPPIVPSATTAAPPTTSAPAAAAPAASNAQFLEELRAIHAEIDARKRHMDSLTAALDSLKHVSRPD